MFGDREQIRQFYFTVWNKLQTDAELQPLEALVGSVIKDHPEYHALLESPDASKDTDFLPDQGQTNPFLHMGMHIALREQIQGRRPAGIFDVYETLVKKCGDAHEAEHQMMECLGEAMWTAQRNTAEPDETTYMECLKKL